LGNKEDSISRESVIGGTPSSGIENGRLVSEAAVGKKSGGK